MNLCVIPARGGSKRIPRKNIRPFAGKPMIAYAIHAAQKSELFSKIIVSTEDAEVCEVSQQCGAEVPFLRPAELADDHTPTVPVVAHAIREMELSGETYSYVCCIYPCVPLLKSEDLKKALKLCIERNADYCFPVAQYPSPIQRALKMTQDSTIAPFFPEFELSRTQDHERAYYDAGQFYWAKKDTWTEKANIYQNSIALVIPSLRAIDIDTKEDWNRASLNFQAASHNSN